MQKNINSGKLGTTQIKGESYALGWNAAANYTFDDKNEMGVVYRSRITHSLEADLKVIILAVKLILLVMPMV